MKRLKEIHWGLLLGTLLIGVPIAAALIASSGYIVWQYAWTESAGTTIERYMASGVALSWVAWTVFALPLSIALWRRKLRWWAGICALTLIPFSATIMTHELGFFAKHQAGSRAPAIAAKQAIKDTQSSIAQLSAKANKLLDRGVVTATTKLIKTIQDQREWNMKTSTIATVAPLQEFLSKWTGIEQERIDFGLLMAKLSVLMIGRDIVPALVFLGCTTALRRRYDDAPESTPAKMPEEIQNLDQNLPVIRVVSRNDTVRLKKKRDHLKEVAEFAESLDKKKRLDFGWISKRYREQYGFTNDFRPNSLAMALKPHGWSKKRKRYTHDNARGQQRFKRAA